MDVATMVTTELILEGKSVMSGKWYFLCPVEKMHHLPRIKKFYGQRLYTEYRVVEITNTVSRRVVNEGDSVD